MGRGSCEATSAQDTVKHPVGYRPEAFADIAEAFLWYEAQRPGLGDEFEQAVGSTVGFLSSMPEAAPVAVGRLRRALIQRFPFAIYYTIEPTSVEIRGVLHTSRDPGEWLRRV